MPPGNSNAFGQAHSTHFHTAWKCSKRPRSPLSHSPAVQNHLPRATVARKRQRQERQERDVWVRHVANQGRKQERQRLRKQLAMSVPSATVAADDVAEPPTTNPSQPPQMEKTASSPVECSEFAPNSKPCCRNHRNGNCQGGCWRSHQYPVKTSHGTPCDGNHRPLAGTCPWVLLGQHPYPGEVPSLGVSAHQTPAKVAQEKVITHREFTIEYTTVTPLPRVALKRRVTLGSKPLELGRQQEPKLVTPLTTENMNGKLSAVVTQTPCGGEPAVDHPEVVFTGRHCRQLHDGAGRPSLGALSAFQQADQTAPPRRGRPRRIRAHQKRARAHHPCQ